MALVLLLLAVALGGYWLLPFNGEVIVTAGQNRPGLTWPQMLVESSPGQSAIVRVTDVVPWSNVELEKDGRFLRPEDWQANPGGTWTWRWTLPGAGGRTFVFYHSCHTGCIERGRWLNGNTATESTSRTPSVPTKLGVVFASPTRNWHDHSGWNVELTYAKLAEREYWGIDDLATRVEQATAQGLKVLVRVDYAQGQTLPPTNDYLALNEYLQYLQRLARDDRLQPVYGYIIGSGFNELGSNSLAPARPVTPQWYARVFNGYGEEVAHADNVMQTIRAERAQVRVLVGPVRPWNREQNGERAYVINVPWLNYMNTLVALLDEGARAKERGGIALTAPDGFAINAPGRPGAPELAGHSAAEEPRLDLRRAEWGGAQAGFRIYRDWLDIVNAYPSTRGLPVYLNSTNTFTPDEGIVPAQNYPHGWLTTAFEVISQEPQVQALCWFLDADRTGDSRWDPFSLTKHVGRVIDADEELDALLQRK